VTRWLDNLAESQNRFMRSLTNLQVATANSRTDYSAPGKLDRWFRW
jgi:hypothetical protein